MNGDESSVLVSKDEGIATITLNRPDKRNPLSRAMISLILETLDDLELDDTIGAVIFTGAGPAFCGGADLSRGAETFDYGTPGDGQKPEDKHEDWGGRLTLRVFSFMKPVIAAVNGPAIGLGATMLLPMDVRLASTKAEFGYVFARRGIVPEAASSWFLPRIVGISTALEWCYSGRRVSAQEALDRNLIKSLHEPEALLPAAREMARSFIVSSAPVSVSLIRQMMWRMLTAAHPMEAHRVDSAAMALRGRSADAREGVQAFLEKRSPRFKDRVSTDLPDIFRESAGPAV